MDSLRVVLWILFWSSLAEGDEDFQEFLFCPTNRELRCQDGEVIDIQQARVASMWAMGITNPCSDLSSKSAITNRFFPQCKMELTFLSCHGHQSCIVTRTMAEVCLPECEADLRDAQPGRKSDFLYVNYTCHELKTPSLLENTPETYHFTSDVFDIISPGFSDVTNEGQYNVTCTITPSGETNKDIALQVETKLLMIEGPFQDAYNDTCLESLEVSLSGRTLFCYQESPIRIRNDIMGTRTGRNFTLEYRSDGTVTHKFWIQFTATKVDGDGDDVDMTVSCTDNLPTKTTETTTTISTETTTMITATSDAPPLGVTSQSSITEEQNNYMIIGVSAGAALLVVIVVVIVVVVFCRRRNRRKKNQPDGYLHPSVPQNNDVSRPYCIVSVITPTPANSYDTNNGASNGAKPIKPPRLLHEAPQSAKNEGMNRIQYADVVVVPRGAVYAQVSQKGRKGKKMDEKEESKNPNMLDGETIMEENTELYAKEVVPLKKMAKNDRKNPQNIEEETVMVENFDLYSKENLGVSDNPFSKDSGDLYDSVSPRQLSYDVMDGYHNVGFSDDEGHSG